MIYLTRGLCTTLLRLARDREPDAVTVPLAVTPAADLPDSGNPADPELDGDTPVFTDFYLPRDADSVTAVFGVDLGTPAGQTHGLFVSHPRGNLGISNRDDLHEVVLVAIPPWEEASVAAFDRRGRRRDMAVLDVEPPTDTSALSAED